MLLGLRTNTLSTFFLSKVKENGTGVSFILSDDDIVPTKPPFI